MLLWVSSVLDAANFSLFSQKGEVTSPLISGPAWTLRLQFTKYQQSYAPMNFFFYFFFCNSSHNLYPEHRIIQEPVYVLHLITCHGRIKPHLAELLFVTFIPFSRSHKGYDFRKWLVSTLSHGGMDEFWLNLHIGILWPWVYYRYNMFQQYVCSNWWGDIPFPPKTLF